MPVFQFAQQCDRVLWSFPYFYYINDNIRNPRQIILPADSIDFSTRVGFREIPFELCSRFQLLKSYYHVSK